MRDLIDLVREFNEARGWRRFHTPRSLILSLCGEVGELAQLFRWHTSGRKLSLAKRKSVEAEIADIFIFLFSLCIELNIDPDKIVRDKLQDNNKRFPVKQGEHDE